MRGKGSYGAIFMEQRKLPLIHFVPAETTTDADVAQTLH
jgi:hypothetical protein